MNRRDFIKAFSKTAIALPLAAQLVQAEDSKPIIETFQNIPDKSVLLAKKETEFDSEPFNLNDYGKVSNVQSNIIQHRTLFLAYNYKSYKDFIHSTPFLPSNSVYIDRKEKMFGYKRGSTIIGLNGYWFHPNINEIMEIIHVRDMSIITPHRYFQLNNIV